MISDITLGQFFPGYSVIHKLDPRTKIILAVAFIVAVFVANNPVAFAILVASCVILVAVSRISFSVVLKGIKPIIFILIFKYITLFHLLQPLLTPLNTTNSWKTPSIQVRDNYTTLL